MIQFDPHLHQYRVEGKVLPSVSEIMRGMSENYYSNVHPAVLQHAADRGTRVHKAIEIYERLGIEPDDDTWVYFDRYLKAKKKHKFEVVQTEIMLTNFQYCGTLDQLILINGELAINDIKVTSKRNIELLEVQLAAYEELALYNMKKVKKCYCTHLTKTSGVMVEIKPNRELWQRKKAEWRFMESLK